MAIGIILGIAILAKGLMGVALVGVAYGSYLLVTRQLTLAACYRGAVSLCVAAAIASIWYLAAERRQPGYLHYYFIERHLLGFATATQTHGDAPWWLYLPTLLGGGLPWIGYLPVTIKELFANNPVACPRLSWACWRGWINRIMPTTSVGMPPGRPEVLALVLAHRLHDFTFARAVETRDVSLAGLPRRGDFGGDRLVAIDRRNARVRRRNNRFEKIS